jgi:hypothetical protein
VAYYFRSAPITSDMPDRRPSNDTGTTSSAATAAVAIAIATSSLARIATDCYSGSENGRGRSHIARLCLRVAVWPSLAFFFEFFFLKKKRKGEKKERAL